MKRTKQMLTALLCAAMLLALTACGGKAEQTAQPQEQPTQQTQSTQGTPTLHRDEDKTPQPTQPASGTPPTGGAQAIDDAPPISLDLVMDYIAGGSGGFEPHALTPAEQATLRADVEAQGGTVTFMPDGSFTIHSPEGGNITLTPDGEVSGVDDDGQSFESVDVSGWPSGPLASAVPQPDFAIGAAFEEAGSLEVMFDGVTIEEAKAYGAQLKTLFPREAEESDYPEYGMYSYSGENAQGVRADFGFFVQGGTTNCMLTVTDPAAWELGGGDDEPDDQPGGYDPNSAGYTPPQEIRYGDTWPTSGLLAMLPAPDFGDDLRVDVEQDKVSATVFGAQPSDFDAYVRLVKARGFTQDVEQENDPDYYNFKLYSAFNSVGNGALVQYMEDYQGSGALGVIVSLPE